MGGKFGTLVGVASAHGITVQFFGVKNSSATRAAERFFKERDVPLLLRLPLVRGGKRVSVGEEEGWKAMLNG